MSLLKFNDGIEFDLSGPLRIEERSDGFYLVGHGTLCAVKDPEEGLLLIANRRKAVGLSGNGNGYIADRKINLSANRINGIVNPSL